jgi:hypothetical protein
MQETTIPIDRLKTDTRSSCNGKPVQAFAVLYKPNTGYTDADAVVVDGQRTAHQLQDHRAVMRSVTASAPPRTSRRIH